MSGIEPATSWSDMVTTRPTRRSIILTIGMKTETEQLCSTQEKKPCLSKGQFEKSLWLDGYAELKWNDFFFHFLSRKRLCWNPSVILYWRMKTASRATTSHIQERSLSIVMIHTSMNTRCQGRTIGNSCRENLLITRVQS